MKPKRYSTSLLLRMEQEEFDHAASLAEELGTTRSELIRDALRFASDDIDRFKKYRDVEPSTNDRLQRLEANVAQLLELLQTRNTAADATEKGQ